MKKVVLILFLAFFSFSTNALAAYTATSHDLTVSQPAQHKLSVGLWSSTNETVELSLYSKGPSGQLHKVFSTTVNIGPTTPSPVEFSVGYLSSGTYVLKGQFQGSYGSLGPVSLHQVY
ncbi:hypothetical protein MH117_02940 [Paenibacillus sp. ACRRX]|uniref:hypothetical protein n=1 Tax=unclassified Paenibacillus TaxID=185978 RepID=UPI001EF51432|nr:MULTISPECIES: hypothetical protein [unclassified Paenibacillus]MCG7406358.1 hypothetical protein [Paenibacillus sp. ACRRX]MDK8179393.1 hypothetical protein [Paenibacillus sp. UMB4589-SE434]